MFETEAYSLKRILNTQTIAAPMPICHGVVGETSFLLLEYLALSTKGSGQLFGECLANLHRYTNDAFGWPHDNWIGTNKQKNMLASNWLEFWRDYRLMPQVMLAEQKGASRKLVDSLYRLLSTCNAFFSGFKPTPSLLHGDLWGGNYGYVDNAMPVIFDPASYFGDREADIAMTELFGGFDDNFYKSYAEHWPLDPGYPVRKNLYNLYHVLNHFNLFGQGYAEQANVITQTLLAECN